MPPILEIDDLSFSYDDVSVLRNLSLQVQKGEFIGVIGPNGGGKTTLLKLLMGFLKPTKGKITICGTSPVTARKHIAYVPQNLRFDRQFPLSVLECVLLGRLSHLPWYGCYSHDDRVAAKEALKTVGLEDFSARSFGTLSTGQAQRVLIARALASKPEILLLDEPTASVDAQSEAAICQLLKSLAGPITILMVTHDIRAIIQDVQRVVCVQGELVSLKPEEVCEHFAYGVYHSTLVQIPPNDTGNG